jgi:hypothetical protein
MGLIPSAIIYVHRHFKALPGVYTPICWLRGVKLRKLEANDPPLSVAKVKIA